MDGLRSSNGIQYRLQLLYSNGKSLNPLFWTESLFTPRQTPDIHAKHLKFTPNNKYRVSRYLFQSPEIQTPDINFLEPLIFIVQQPWYSFQNPRYTHFRLPNIYFRTPYIHFRTSTIYISGSLIFISEPHVLILGFSHLSQFQFPPILFYHPCLGESAQKI